MAKTKIGTRQLKINARDSVRFVLDSNASVAAAAPDTVDGGTVVAGDRILLAGQTAADENGIYVVDTVGTGVNGVWSRAIDMDEDAEVRYGDTVHVIEGTSYARTWWSQSEADPLVVGVDNLAWARNTDTGLLASNFVMNEVPAGAVNGTNVTFTLANTPILGKESIYLNGQRLVKGAGADYTISGAVVTLADAPKAAPGNPDVVIADYIF